MTPSIRRKLEQLAERHQELERHLASAELGNSIAQFLTASSQNSIALFAIAHSNNGVCRYFGQIIS